MKIFVSYRREDSIDITSRICDHLRGRFGRNAILLDVDVLFVGLDFAGAIMKLIEAADVVLVVIGQNWLNIEFRDESRSGARRLDDPTDLVRLELAAALNATFATVIPVLVGGAAMPSSHQLPAELRKLSSLEPVAISSGPLFIDQLYRLVWRLDRAEMIHGLTWPAREIERRKARPNLEIENRTKNVGHWRLGPLVKCLGRETKAALEAAVGFAFSRRHRKVEPEHWLSMLLEHEACTDIDVLLNLPMFAQVHRYTLRHELTDALRARDGENEKALPEMGISMSPWIVSSWAIASLEFSDYAIRSSHLVYALARNPTMVPSLALLPTLARFLEGFQDLTVVEHLDVVAESSEGEATVEVASNLEAETSIPRDQRPSREERLRRVSDLERQLERMVVDEDADPIEKSQIRRALFSARRELAR